MEVLNRIKNPKDIQKLSFKELEQLAEEIREFLIDNVSKTGGHLASNLGIVELTLSLLKNFDFEHDKIVFDVGHQSYVYKILTGRKDDFSTLRTYKGISGFPKREESCYDFFDTGHSSNSISACLGMARARDLQKEDYHIVSVIGDGAFTGGMVYEALNDVGFNNTKMLIILNDNQMSISSNVGGLSKCLNKVRLAPSYNKLKEKAHSSKKSYFVKTARKVKNSIKTLFFNPMFFENLGVRYVGPIDGNNLEDLNRVMKKIKNIKEPVVLHVLTTKGLGYLPALENPDSFHAVSKFDIVTGKAIQSNSDNYSNAFGESLLHLAEKDEKIVAITAAMIGGTGLSKFYKKYPERTFDVGITEPHAVTLAGGMACGGLHPIFVVYSTFLQRGFDQVLIDICMQNLPVVFAIDRAGLVGNDGKTHQGVFDLSYLNLMPNMDILAPKCTEEMEKLLSYAIHQDHPVAIRYPRGGDVLKLAPIKKVVRGRWEKVVDGNGVAILAVGKMNHYASLAMKKLNKKQKPLLINACFIKPLDEEILKEIVQKGYSVLTLEDNNILGGFGQQVLYELNKLGFHKKIKIMGYEDKFIDHGNVDELLVQEKMDVDSIVQEIQKLYT